MGSPTAQPWWMFTVFKHSLIVHYYFSHDTNMVVKQRHRKFCFFQEYGSTLLFSTGVETNLCKCVHFLKADTISNPATVRPRPLSRPPAKMHRVNMFSFPNTIISIVFGAELKSTHYFITSKPLTRASIIS